MATIASPAHRLSSDDPASEREKRIAANQAFAAALKQALRSGGETSAAVLATVSPKRDKNGSLAL